MSTILTQASHTIVWCCMFFLGLALLVLALGLRINTTPSILKGIYQIQERPIKKGEFIIFCPPNNAAFKDARTHGYTGFGFCKGNHGALMKQIIAASGDSVTINKSGIFVNGRLLKHSQPIGQDVFGNIIKIASLLNYPLKQNEYLVLGNNSSASFDSRYFGVIKKDFSIKVIHPIFVLKN